MKTATISAFRGCWIPFEIDEILMPDEVFAAHDQDGTRYLIAHTTETTWLCAPISDRALACVQSGRAELRDVFAHTLTGMAERLTVRGATVCGESLVPCADLTDDVLPRPGVRLCWRARCA